MILKRKVFQLLFCLVFGWCSAQPLGDLRHFSHDVKLNQSRILDIQQDNKGFIWLGTFNGLIRYDGNNFQNFEVSDRGSLNLMSNRVSKFTFDKDGRIWIKSEKEEIYYFDRQDLRFHFPIESKDKENGDLHFSQFKLVASGRIWLFDEKKNYCVAFERNKELTKVFFDKVKFKACKIQDVFEDITGTTWFLTNSGLCRLKKGSSSPEYFFFNMLSHSGKSYSFNESMETKEDIWFAGANGRILKYNKKTTTFFEPQLPIVENIAKIAAVAGNKLLIVTDSNSFYSYDLKTTRLDVFNYKTLPGLANEKINFIGITHSRRFWFETAKAGLFQFDLLTAKLNLMKVTSNDSFSAGTVPKTFLLRAPDGAVWLQSKKGIFSYWDEKNNRLIPISRLIKKYDEEISDVMHTARFDKSGNLWFCSFKQGLDLLVFNNEQFSTLNLGIAANKQKHNVRCLMKDRSGYLWVASRSHKISIVNAKKEVVGLLGADGTLSANSPAWGADVYSMLEDKKGRVWVGTRGNGLFCLTPSGSALNYKVTHFKYQVNNPYSISSDHVYKIIQTSKGQIYLTTWGGGINLIEEENNRLLFINHRNKFRNYPLKSAEKVRSIVEYKNNTIFFVASNRLFSFTENKQAEKIRFKEYSQIFGSDILDIIVTSSAQLALATNGKGLFMANLDEKNVLKVKSFNKGAVGFSIGGIVSLQEDNSRDLWLVGDNQIIRFNPKKNTVESFPELRTIIGKEIFSEATKGKTLQGEMFFGNSNGVIYFKPEQIKPKNAVPYLAIIEFEVNNKELHEINPEAPANPDLLETIELEHNQNFFKVQFSALNYVNNDDIIYRYKLLGIDKEWNYLKGQQSINYTNLSRGEYELVISSTNDHGLWVNNERRIKIKILPSIWASNVALFFYGLLAFGLFFIGQRIFLTIMKLRNDVQLQKQMSELKLKFFTDISHEIRTPLTMITAPVEKMLLDESLPDSVKSQLSLIERNTNRLLNLVNQILDLRRIQNRKLEVGELNLSKFATKICENFRELSLQSKIRLEVISKGKNPHIWADSESIEKILVNLISNAFKYCRKGDAIEVIIEETEKEVVLKVKDNGPGINPGIQKRLFIRFSNYNENPNNPSTGIGLSIVKDLIDQHGATITVNSEPDQGSCFEISFLKGYQHFNEDVDILFDESEERLIGIEDKIENELVKPAVREIEKGKLVGLIVEDDPELRTFIVSVLEDEYTIHVAENGIEGHLKVASLAPDFVISDIMMPHMDGIEMLKLIRNNITTSHIPVVLLSAKSSIESKLEGMEYGADEYVIKPFNVSYLKARIKNLLEQRKRLQFLYSSGKITEIPVEESMHISNQDHKFMLQVIKLVKDNLSNADFSVDELGKLMYMSRASFFNKLKDLTGLSPVVFIRDMRLNEAAEMIKKDDMLIKEICFEVGFNDLKYFGKCFKEKFNYTPAEYRRLYQ